MASIEKRGENKYRITVSCGYDRNGKKIHQRKTVEIEPNLTPKQHKKELDRLTAEFEIEVKNGDYVSSEITFEKFTEQWLIEYAKKRLEETTIDSYRRELETKIYPAIGHIKLKELKPLHLIKFYDNLTEDGVRLDGKKGSYSSRIIKYQHSIISSILQTAVYWQVINDNVARKVQPPKGADIRKGENYLDEVQIRNLLNYIMENEPLIYQALAFVTAYGGLRKGEVLGLDWSDVDFNNNSIGINKAYTRAAKKEFIKSPKNSSSTRVVALPRIVMTLLKKLKLSAVSNTRVFPIPYSSPTHWMEKVIKNYNVASDNKVPESITFHGLRHTSATLLIAQGLDIKTVSARLGHADTTTTLNIYAHAIKSRDLAASEALEDLLDIKAKK